MKIFDFNLHLPLALNDSVEQSLETELMHDGQSLYKAFSQHKDKIEGYVNGANIMLFSADALLDNAEPSFIESVSNLFDHFTMTVMLDFRSKEAYSALDALSKKNISAIKFHSYFQKITDSDFPDVLRLSEYAQSLGISVAVCTSYGTSNMYLFDGMHLACYLSNAITRVPLILLHSGGAKAIDAMLLAAEKKNVYLESSFSLNYYQGSTIEKDLAFSYRKIGVDRILYGSDYPYVSMEDSIRVAQEFFLSNHYSEVEMEKIFFLNAMNLFQLQDD